MPDPVAGTKVTPEVKAKIQQVALWFDATESWVIREVGIPAAINIAEQLDAVAA